MRLTIAAVPVVVGRFNLQIRDPGVIRYVAFERKKSLIMARGTPEFEEVPVLFMESSPDQPTRNRNLVVIRQGDVIEVEDDERYVWCGTGLGSMIGVIHVFEMRKVQA